MKNIVNISRYGKVQCGKISKGKDPVSKLVFHYYGIPFAQPPVGKLRFLPPQTALPWNGVLQKTCQEHVPVQPMDDIAGFHEFSPRIRDFYKKHCNEDCLYLNVFVPQVLNSTKLPVLVWFYGGGFQIGPQSFFDGSILAGMNDVIVVVPNYRVNTFGFMSLGKESPCKGNLGLLDQLQALRWVKESISAFGGNEDNITIFGQSAGGISVHMHMLSPLSQGYFHKAISFSGTAAMAREVCLVSHFGSSLSVEPPTSQLARGQFAKVPYMLGGTNSEGGWVMNSLIPSYLKGCTEKQYFNYCAPLLKWFDRKIDPKKALPLLLKTYNDKEPLEDKMYYTNAIAGIMGDAYFISGIAKVAKIHAASGAPTFCYHMTHAPSYHHDDDYGPPEVRKPPNVGADHGDDVYLIFGAPFDPERTKEGFRFSEEEKSLSRKLMTYISNFAKSGDPNVGSPVDFNWPSYIPNGRRHLVMDIPLKTDSNLGSDVTYLYYNVLPKL